jgi:hypothetical protein
MSGESDDAVACDDTNIGRIHSRLEFQFIQNILSESDVVHGHLLKTLLTEEA